MSKELYPSNSTIIDIRNRITSVQASSKTKEFINDLHRMSGGTTPVLKDQFLQFNKTYESERWFLPRNDDESNTTLPPRRSIYTPSRLQNLSVQRNREARKPYWRCPLSIKKPTAAVIKTSTTSTFIDTVSTRSTQTHVPFIIADPIPQNTSSIEQPTQHYDQTTCKLNINQSQDAISKKYSGTCDVLDQQERNFVFTFTEPLLREPSCPTSSQAKSLTNEIGIQTEVDDEKRASMSILSSLPLPISKVLTAEIKTNELDSIITANETNKIVTTLNGTTPISNEALSGANMPAPFTDFNNPIQFNSAPVPPSGAVFQFGTSTNGNETFQFEVPSAKEALSGPNMPPTLNIPEPFTDFGSAFQFNSAAAPPPGAVFQFGASTNANGAFQFGEPSTNGLSDGLTTRSTMATRKLLHAKRTKRR